MNLSPKQEDPKGQGRLTLLLMHMDLCSSISHFRRRPPMDIKVIDADLEIPNYIQHPWPMFVFPTRISSGCARVNFGIRARLEPILGFRGFAGACAAGGV